MQVTIHKSRLFMVCQYGTVTQKISDVDYGRMVRSWLGYWLDQNGGTNDTEIISIVGQALELDLDDDYAFFLASKEP